jgi:hypothetical protein
MIKNRVSLLCLLLCMPVSFLAPPSFPVSWCCLLHSSTNSGHSQVLVQVCPGHGIHTTRGFLPTTPQELLWFHSLDSVAPARVHSSQLSPQGYTPQPPEGFPRPNTGAQHLVADTHKGSLTCDAMRSDAMRHTSNSATNCGGATRSATT